MFEILDLASISVIVASFALVMYNIRVELKAKV
jgi:hypothetical protein